MSACYLSPVFGAGAQLFTNLGVVLQGGSIRTFLAGTSTPAATFTDSTGGTSNGVSITLDGAGRPPQEIWLTSGTAYKFFVYDSNNVQVGNAYDFISGVNDPSAGVVPNTEWVASGLTPSYISSTSFTFPGDVRTIYPIGQRLKSTVTAGTAYSTVLSVAFSSVTTIVVQNDSTALDAGLSVVFYGLFNAANPSIDAIGVKYSNGIIPPTTPSNVGGTLQRVDRSVTLTTTSGVGTAYVLTPVQPLGAYATNAPVLVKFSVDSGAAPTMNITALGAKNLMQINSSGTKVAATVKAGQIAEVVYDGTDLVALIPSSSGRLLRTTIFKASGTWTKQADVSFVQVEMVGGGGGATTAAGGCGGGGAGEYAFKTISSPGATEAVTVGAGGVGAGNGTLSGFGSWVTANGGTQGPAIAGGPGGTGGTGADLAIAGGGGGYGGFWSANNYYGPGGNSYFGAGAQGDLNRSAGISAAANSGAGASGGSSGGGTGGSGVVIVREYS